MANARNSLPSAAGQTGAQGAAARGRKGAPFPAPVRLLPPLTLRSFAGHSGSTQGQLKLTAIYCISIMVSHLPLRGGPASRVPFCTAAYSPVSPPHASRTRATRELGLYSRFTTSFMVHTVREHAEVPYGQLSAPRGASAMATVLFPINYPGPRAYTHAAIFTLPRKLVSASKNTWPLFLPTKGETRTPREFRSLRAIVR